MTVDRDEDDDPHRRAPVNHAPRAVRRPTGFEETQRDSPAAPMPGAGADHVVTDPRAATSVVTAVDDTADPPGGRATVDITDRDQGSTCATPRSDSDSRGPNPCSSPPPVAHLSMVSESADSPESGVVAENAGDGGESNCLATSAGDSSRGSDADVGFVGRVDGCVSAEPKSDSDFGDCGPISGISEVEPVGEIAGSSAAGAGVDCVSGDGAISPVRKSEVGLGVGAGYPGASGVVVAGATDVDARRLAWVYLSRVVEGPCAALSALIEAVGVVEAARAVRECALPEALRGPTELRRGIERAEQDLGVMERLGGRVITPDDAEWPGWRMLGLGQLDPKQDEAGAVPLVLWARGPRSLVECTERAVAVVGARCSTAYGNHVTGEIAAELAVRGWTIVSGAAFGIDGMAHRAALAVGGTTVAVLACGADRPYPVQHDRLLAEIAETGLVVTEYPPGTSARKHHFLARNRLIAALADTVVVVEAGARSGARNTVKWSRRLGRPALAVPGPITSASSVGCHRMIREGEAFMVTSAEEILDEAGPLRLSLPGVVPPAPEENLRGEEALIMAALPGVGSRLPRALVSDTGLSLPVVRATLSALEIAGLVACDDNGWHRLSRS